MKRNILSFLVALLAATLAYLFFAPVPIAPAAWTPPAAPALVGPYEQNSRLAPVERLSLGQGHAPEDVAIDAAFFTMNGVISIVFFAFVLAERLLRLRHGAGSSGASSGLLLP